MIPVGSVRWLAARFRSLSSMLTLSLVGGFAAAVLSVVASYAMGKAFDDALKSGLAMGPLVTVAVALFASQVIRGALMLMRHSASITLGTRLERDMRQDLITACFADPDPGAAPPISTLISDTRALRFMVTPGLDLGIAVTAFVVVVPVSAAIWSPQLIWAPIAYAVGFTILSARQLRRLRAATGAVRSQAAGMAQQIAEALDNIEVVRDASCSDTVWERLAAASVAHRDATVRQGRQERRAPLFLLLGLVQGLGFWWGLELARNHQITVGGLVGYQTLLMLLGAPTFGAAMSYNAIANGLAAAARIRSAVPETSLTGRRGGQDDEPADDRADDRDQVRNEARDEAGGGGRRFDRVPAIELHGVEPPSGRLAFDRVDLSVPPRSLVAVVGPNGSGKSTLLKLLAGLERPVAGTVVVGGVALDLWHRSELRRRVVYVADHESLFSMTLAENIGLGRLAAGHEEIVRAGGLAGVSEFAESLPERWRTPLGARGMALSGGQRQRVAIARAVLSDAAVLLLDDPFSALDTTTSRRLADTLVAEARERTVIIVTDRSDIVEHASHVVRLGEHELTVTPGPSQGD